jgi:hypothetical protein
VYEDIIIATAALSQPVGKGSLTFVIRLLETSIVSAKFRSSNIYQKDGKLFDLCHADMNI